MLQREKKKGRERKKKRDAQVVNRKRHHRLQLASEMHSAGLMVLSVEEWADGLRSCRLLIQTMKNGKRKRNKNNRNPRRTLISSDFVFPRILLKMLFSFARDTVLSRDYLSENSCSTWEFGYLSFLPFFDGYRPPQVGCGARSFDLFVLKHPKIKFEWGRTSHRANLGHDLPTMQSAEAFSAQIRKEYLDITLKKLIQVYKLCPVFNS